MNKSSIVLACATTLVLLGSIVSGCKKDKDPDLVATLPTEGLVMQFSFNGNTLDGSPHQNNGTSNNLQWVSDRKGVNQSAVYFTGVGSYIQIPHSGVYNFAANQDYTISCWVKYGQQDQTGKQDNYILSKWHASPSPGNVYPFSLRLNNQTAINADTRGLWYAVRRDGSTCNNLSSLDGAAADDDQWHHIVVVKKSTVLYGYMDGVEIGTTSDNTTCSTQNASPLYIGCYHPSANANDRWYKGALDDLRIYNRALTEKEIKQLFKE